MKTPVPKPTVINEPRARCGMVRRKTAEEMVRKWNENYLRMKYNLRPIVE